MSIMYDQGPLESYNVEYSLQAPASSRPAASQAVQLFRRSRPRSSTILQRQKRSYNQAKLSVQKSTRLKQSSGSNHSSKGNPQALLDTLSCALPTQQTSPLDTLAATATAFSTQQQLLALLQQRVHSSLSEQQQEQEQGNAGALSHLRCSSTRPSASEAAPAPLATLPLHSMAQQQQQQQTSVMQHRTMQPSHSSLHQQQQQPQQLLRNESLQSTSTATPAALRSAFEAAVAPNPPLAVAAVVSRLLISVGACHVSHEFAAQLKDQVMDSMMQATAAADAAGRPFVPDQVLLQMIPQMKAAVTKAWNEKKARTRAAEDAPDLTPEQQYRITALKAAMAVRAAAAAAATSAAAAAGTTTTSLQSQQTEEQGEHSSGHALVRVA